MNFKPGEMICEVCNGHRYIKKNNVKIPCFHCQGTGKLDWIENIIGKTFQLSPCSRSTLGPWINSIFYDKVTNKLKQFDGKKWILYKEKKIEGDINEKRNN